MRLSVGEVCMTYSQRSLANVGEIARPSRPPSPSVLCTLGTVPTLVFTPVAGSRRIDVLRVAAAVEHGAVGQGDQAPRDVGVGGDLR